MYTVKLGVYKATLTEDLIKKYKTAYGLDRYLLSKFEQQGFRFSHDRSQYIRYCFWEYDGVYLE